MHHTLQFVFKDIRHVARIPEGDHNEVGGRGDDESAHCRKLFGQGLVGRGAKRGEGSSQRADIRAGGARGFDGKVDLRLQRTYCIHLALGAEEQPDRCDLRGQDAVVCPDYDVVQGRAGSCLCGGCGAFGRFR